MFARLVQFASVALALVIGSHASAAPLSYGTYYDETVYTNLCTNTQFCGVTFSQTPADKLVMVGKINCAVSSTAPPSNIILQIMPAPNSAALTRQLPISFPAPQLIGGTYFTNFETNTHFLIGQGRFPILVSVTQIGATSQAKCTLIGDLVTPIQ
jgi:hypothetical protein